NAKITAELLAEKIDISPEKILLASTGLIGEQLPMEFIGKGISEAVDSLNKEGGKDAAEAILTTDTFVKEIAVKLNLSGREVIIGAMAKGAGMINPNLATMLGFVTTDAVISKDLLGIISKICVEESFNLISVDGDMSTNDQVIIMANGKAGNNLIESETDTKCFKDGLLFVLKKLASMIVKDGEGATKFIKIKIKGCLSKDSAKKIGLTIANSLLVKTAFYGEDVNWGRIMNSMGSSGVDFNQNEVEIWFENIKIVQNGEKANFNKEDAENILKQKEIEVIIDLNQGSEEAEVLTTDLSKEYVEFNSRYST
ncbi:MAG: bifunctional glutamate N-acetyltransferase/amino-acid acetyltransferase ArgJ, partial [Actinomycetia bacterium]|nr:bifunctional glutamate N-acetyltransferase/amino-acid acetyltransferase ArgJ [Actinomycetes bacterium]